MSLKFPVKVLLLGGDGMLGSAFPFEYEDLQIIKTYRKSRDEVLKNLQIDYEIINGVYGIDPFDQTILEKLIIEIKPRFIINCIGWVKQRQNEILDNFIKCNSILPWYLDGICSRHQIKLINFSTDCVFRGTVGNYNEESIPDASDIYGVTKRLGEVHSATTLNLRTSFFGLEGANAVGLIEWFLSQKGVVKGFSGAIYSGIYNKLFAINVLDLIVCNPTMYGLWHIASIPTSKFKILSAIKGKLNLKDIEVIDDSEFKCDRSLNCEKIVKEIGYKKFTWDFMLDSLCDDILIRKQLCSKTKK